MSTAPPAEEAERPVPATKPGPEGAPVAGTYSFGRAGQMAQWDAHAWTGQVTEVPAQGALPKWHHGFLPFLRHWWFAAMVVGTVLSVAPAFVASSTNSPRLALLCLPGFAVFMYGGVILITRHEFMHQLPNRRSVIVWGLVSGIVAIVLATTIEGVFEPKIMSFDLGLWLAGPVEETSKLLVPVILWLVAGARFRDPRAGLLMVLISASVFGAIEALEYTTSAEHYGMLAMGIARPVGELLHPLLTGFAATVIWLAASRSGRLVTAAGALAWVIAMFIHSFHDGIITFFTTPSTAALSLPTVGEALATAAFLFSLELIVTILLYLLCRHAAREVTPPNSVLSNSPHWRPAIKAWGVRRGHS